MDSTPRTFRRSDSTSNSGLKFGRQNPPQNVKLPPQKKCTTVSDPPFQNVRRPEKNMRKSRTQSSSLSQRRAETHRRKRKESDSGSPSSASSDSLSLSLSHLPSLSRSHLPSSRSQSSHYARRSRQRSQYIPDPSCTPSKTSSTPSPARGSITPGRRGILRNKHRHFKPSVKLKTPPRFTKKIQTLSAPKKIPQTPPVPSCFPISSTKVDAHVEEAWDSESDPGDLPPPIIRRTSSRLRQFEHKRQKLHLFKARCFSDTRVVRKSSDDFEDVTTPDAPDVSTINVFESRKRQPVGSDTIRFRSHIKFTCELFDTHMEDQYKGKIVDGKCIYNYWLFYQQVERFRKDAMEILAEALNSNDKQLLRDAIDDMKQEVQLLHFEFLNFDSRHIIEIEDKSILKVYSRLLERTGSFMRQSRGGEIQPHEMVTMFDDLQSYCVEEFLEQVFIDFCYFTMMNFIIPQKTESSESRLAKKAESLESSSRVSTRI